MLSASAHTARASQGADLTDLIASQSAFDTAMTLSGQNVTVVGNLEVQGTTTTVDSTTVELGDNILALNGTGAARGGIHVNDANGPLSGSLIWDGTQNYWLAGGSGSEFKVFTAGGDDNLVSGSSQVTISNTTGYATYSSSVQTYTDAKIAALSASADTHLDANISSLSGAAHTQRAALISSLSSSVDTHLDANISALSASVDTHLDANIASLSASAHTARATGATSASAHAQRVALIATLSASVDTHLDANISALSSSVDTHLDANISALSGAAHTQRDALISSLSASAAAANDSSAITVRNLVNQDVALGTGDISAVSGSFTKVYGDGSNLTNITVDQNATVAATFTNQTSVATDHNFGTKNVLVQVYNSDDEQIIPATITSTTANRTTITFDTSTSGTVVIARGGHIVSGSVNTFGGQAPEYYAASGSSHAQRVALISTLSSSVDTHLDANIAALSASAHAARAGGATSASAHTQRIAVVNNLSSSAATALRAEYVAGDNALSSSAATALRTEYVAADTALSASQKTYIDAKVAGIVNSAPATLDTLDELAAALNDDPNFSASIATSIGNRVLTSTFNTYSGSAAAALRTEYAAGDTALSSSAHTQREAIKTIASNANNTLSSSIATALRTEYVAGDNALSASAHTARNEFRTKNTAQDGRLDALETFTGSLDATYATEAELNAATASLSGAAHTQREAIKTIASNANNTLSSSIATALRTEYTAGDSALSASAHTQREAVKTIASNANNSLSSSIATALRSEYSAADTALSSSQKTYIDAKVAGIVNSAPATLDTLDELAAALNDDPNFSASIATSIGNRVLTSTFNTYSGSAAGALRTEYTAGDTALSSSAHTQREAIKTIASNANNSLSSSTAAALRTEYVAGDSALSASAHTARNEFRTKNTAQDGRLDALETFTGSLDATYATEAELNAATASLSGAAHTQREAIKTIASNANNTLSSSIATALRAEYVAGDNSLSSSAATALRAEYVAADNSLSSSAASALRTEYVAGDNALSGAAHTARRNEIAALSASADTHLDANIAALSASAHTARGTIESSFTIAGGSGSDTFNTGDTLTFAGTANEIETTVTDDQVAIGIVTNPTLTGNVTITGDLIVTGDTIEQQVTNLNVEDKFILINSGSAAADAGLVVDGAGASFGWDQSAGRWAFDFAGALANQTTITSDAHAVAVVTSDDANYQKTGNIRVDGDDIYIYS